MISVTILTKNSQETLSAALDSVKKFSEVLVYDTGSDDRTLAIASTYPNVRIIQGPFQGFGPTHNTAAMLAQHDWILSLDSDEILSAELAEEILNLTLHPSSVYELDRHNYFNGKWIRWCGGWYPDRVIRLYHRKMTSFSTDIVHEKILPQALTIIPLLSPIYHTPYRSIHDFLSKMQLYSTLFAEQRRGTTQASVFKALLHGWFACIKSYIFKRGFLGGKEGLIISLYNGHVTFYKYLKLTQCAVSKSDMPGNT